MLCIEKQVRIVTIYESDMPFIKKALSLTEERRLVSEWVKKNRHNFEKWNADIVTFQYSCGHRTLLAISHELFPIDQLLDPLCSLKHHYQLPATLGRLISDILNEEDASEAQSQNK